MFGSEWSALAKKIQSFIALDKVEGLLGHSKCGVVVSAANEGGGSPFNPFMLRSGASHGLAWHTDWGAGGLQPGFTALDYGRVRLVPQFWGAQDYDFAPQDEPTIPVMLGFNEPDHANGGASPMDVSSAMYWWMRLVAKARAKGYRYFVGPSIAEALPERYTGQGPGNEWLPRFLELCLTTHGCSDTIDYLGFHLYEPNCPTDPEVVRKFNMDVRVGSLKKVMSEFNNRGMNIRGLWLTEFGGRSGPSGQCQTLAQQRAWVEVLLPMLNDEPAVVAYSWFSYGDGRSPFFHDNANLWDYQTNGLTELGETYFKLCNVSASTQDLLFWIVVCCCFGAVLIVIAVCGVVVRSRRLRRERELQQSFLRRSSSLLGSYASSAWTALGRYAASARAYLGI